MQIQLKAPKIWLANEPVDFRKGANGLSELIITKLNKSLDDQLYIFYNRAKNKVKILAYHRNGSILIYKRLDKKKFTFKENALSLYEVSEQELSWLLAGLAKSSETHSSLQMELFDENEFECQTDYTEDSKKETIT